MAEARLNSAWIVLNEDDHDNFVSNMCVFHYASGISRIGRRSSRLNIFATYDANTSTE